MKFRLRTKEERAEYGANMKEILIAIFGTGLLACMFIVAVVFTIYGVDYYNNVSSCNLFEKHARICIIVYSSLVLFLVMVALFIYFFNYFLLLKIPFLKGVYLFFGRIDKGIDNLILKTGNLLSYLWRYSSFQFLVYVILWEILQWLVIHLNHFLFFTDKC